MRPCLSTWTIGTARSRRRSLKRATPAIQLSSARTSIWASTLTSGAAIEAGARAFCQSCWPCKPLEAGPPTPSDTLRALLQHPSCVGAVDLEKGHAEGNTPLSAASHIGDPEVIGILLAAGAQVDAPRADTYYPPLTTAMALGHRDAVRRLLEGGAGTCLVAMALDRRQSARQCTATATLHATTTLARPWPTDARADPNYVHKKQRVKLSAVHECCGSSLDLHTNLLLLMDLLNTTRVTAATMRSVVTLATKYPRGTPVSNEVRKTCALVLSQRLKGIHRCCALCAKFSKKKLPACPCGETGYCGRECRK